MSREKQIFYREGLVQTANEAPHNGSSNGKPGAHDGLESFRASKGGLGRGCFAAGLLYEHGKRDLQLMFVLESVLVSNLVRSTAQSNHCFNSK